MSWLNELAENIQEELDHLGYRVAISDIKKFMIRTREDTNINIYVSTKKLAQLYLKKEVKSR